jgi:septal ring factor EnvC (AmiA/AmiB activator)
MQTLEIVKLCMGSGGLLGIGFMIFKLGRFAENFINFKGSVNKDFEKMDKKFDSIEKRFDKVDFEIKEIRRDIYDVKERITYLDAETILYNTITDPNSRSEAAKRSWVRRKAKQVAKLEKK